jgi:hypothetical protein
MVSSLLNPHCARRPTPAAVASAAGHNPETGGAPSFNNCRRAVVARRAALGDAQGMSLGPGAANNSVEDRSGRQTALRLDQYFKCFRYRSRCAGSPNPRVVLVLSARRYQQPFGAHQVFQRFCSEAHSSWSRGAGDTIAPSRRGSK